MSDTSQILLAVTGTGVTLLGILAGLLVSLFRLLRQDMVALRQEAHADNAALNSRIDALYQTLFSHKNPAV